MSVRLVKPDAVQKQFHAEQAATDTALGGTPGTPTLTPDQTVTKPGGAPAGQPLAPAKPKRYYGSVLLNPQRVGCDAGKIAEEIVQRLALQPGAKATLEIQAQMPEGAPDNIARIATENARTQEFTAQGFEPE